MKAFVIGNPVSHSLSPAIFAYLANVEQRPLIYQKKEVRPESLESFLSAVREDKDVKGFNVTLPLKEKIVSLLDEVSSEATFINAVNVVKFSASKAYGYNTDIIGIEKTLETYFPTLEGSHCLIWGAGGSARALTYVLGKLKVKEVYIYNPHSRRGEELALHSTPMFPGTVFKSINDLDEISSVKLTLTVNTTPVGLEKGDPASEVYFKSLKKLTFNDKNLAFDFIYNHGITSFMKVAQSLGLTTVNGLGMFIDQAIATWIIWHDSSEGMYSLHASLIKYLEGILSLKLNSSPLFLTGFMGVGKSTVAKALAEITGRSFLDTDGMIENETGQTVQAFFQSHGEESFREIEKEMVLKCLQTKNTIVSLGGGALLDHQLFDLLMAQSKVVYLAASIEKLAERLKKEGDKRPLLQSSNDQERKDRIRELLKKRKAHYERVSLKVDTSLLTVKDVVSAVLSKLNEVT